MSQLLSKFQFKEPERSSSGEPQITLHWKESETKVINQHKHERITGKYQFMINGMAVKEMEIPTESSKKQYKGKETGAAMARLAFSFDEANALIMAAGVPEEVPHYIARSNKDNYAQFIMNRDLIHQMVKHYGKDICKEGRMTLKFEKMDNIEGVDIWRLTLLHHKIVRK